MSYRERPNCRRQVIRMTTERNCPLEALVDGTLPGFLLSTNIRIQVQKMIQERDQR